MQNGTSSSAQGARLFGVLPRPRRHSVRAHEKRVPASVFTRTDGDPGRVPARALRRRRLRLRVESKASRYVGLGSRSENLLKDVQRLLSAFGVRGRIYPSRQRAHEFPTRETTGPSESTPQVRASTFGSAAPTSRASPTRSGSRRRASRTSSTRFSQRRAVSRPRRGTRLVAREDDGQEVVYNLTEPLHHSYIVDGVVVANCSEYMSIDDWPATSPR